MKCTERKEELLESCKIILLECSESQKNCTSQQHSSGIAQELIYAQMGKPYQEKAAKKQQRLAIPKALNDFAIGVVSSSANIIPKESRNAS